MNSQKFNRLLQQIQHDSQAIKEIYEEYFPGIVMHVKRRFGRLVSAEDIGHDVFLTLMTTKHFPYVEFPATWLYKISDRKAIDRMRSQTDETHLPEFIADSFLIDDLLTEEDIKQGMEQLDKDSQILIYLHYWEGYDHKEIAEMMNLSYSNVRVKVSRAYSVLKCYLR